jgi:hypothetical protein
MSWIGMSKAYKIGYVYREIQEIHAAWVRGWSAREKNLEVSKAVGEKCVVTHPPKKKIMHRSRTGCGRTA